jgi:predicted short-subunit dehydrogenase-like oxidoreductase (DUF2520 family)
MTSALQASPTVTVHVVGRGRLGRPLARALRAAGVDASGPTGRDESTLPADIVLLCVPDAEIACAAATVRDTARFVGHLSGATPLAGSAVDFSIHPLRSFTGDEGPDAFGGIGFAVTAASPEALDAAHDLVARLGGRPFGLADDQRAGYHAAASIASNFVVTLLAAAERVAGSSGITASDARTLFAPLVRGTVENWVALGPDDALTGPVARGDIETVARQRAAIDEFAPDLLPLFDVLCESTRRLAARGRSTE